MTLPGVARRNGAALIEVNPEVTALTADCDISIRGAAAEVLPRLFGLVR